MVFAVFFQNDHLNRKLIITYNTYTYFVYLMKFVGYGCFTKLLQETSSFKGGQLNFYYDQNIKLTGLVSFDMLFHEVSFPES